MRQEALNDLKEEAKKGYDALFFENVSEWKNVGSK